MAKESYLVLVVDDSADDRLFIRRAIQRNKRMVIVDELDDGEAAIAYLDGREPFQNRQEHPFPDAVLLDLKMPLKTGHEVLEWLQTRPFDRLFVAIISGLFLQEDIEHSMELGADAYYKKSAFREEQEAIINEIANRLDGL